MRWKPINSFRDVSEAEIVKGMLENNDISAEVMNNLTGSNYAYASSEGNVFIYVPEDSFLKSRKLLEDKGYNLSHLDNVTIEDKLGKFLHDITGFFRKKESISIQ